MGLRAAQAPWPYQVSHRRSPPGQSPDACRKVRTRLYDQNTIKISMTLSQSSCLLESLHSALLLGCIKISMKFDNPDFCWETRIQLQHHADGPAQVDAVFWRWPYNATIHPMETEHVCLQQHQEYMYVGQHSLRE